MNQQEKQRSVRLIIKWPTCDLPAQPLMRFGCLEPDANGRWYFPIYVDGVRTGKSYTERNHWNVPAEDK